ncbi:hypothetical protein ACFL0D_04175 [Thermoproteota archaeon]
MNNVIKALEEISNELYEISRNIENQKIDLSQDDKKKIYDQHRNLATSFGVLETVLNKIHKNIE